MCSADELSQLLRHLSADETAEEEWSHLDCIVGDWIERKRRRIELGTVPIGARAVVSQQLP